MDWIVETAIKQNHSSLRLLISSKAHHNSIKCKLRRLLSLLGVRVLSLAHSFRESERPQLQRRGATEVIELHKECIRTIGTT